MTQGCEGQNGCYDIADSRSRGSAGLDILELNNMFYPGCRRFIPQNRNKFNLKISQFLGGHTANSLIVRESDLDSWRCALGMPHGLMTSPVAYKLDSTCKIQERDAKDKQGNKSLMCY
jgi:hypothetical protein